MVLANQVSDVDANDPPDNMVANFTVGFSTVNACLLPYTPIYDIQGSGLTAAITGNVSTQGVVVGDNEGASPALRGFFLQDLSGDDDPATSDGIFVFNGNNNSVNLGDVVRVTGKAEEYQGQTQISSVTSIVNCGTGPIESDRCDPALRLRRLPPNNTKACSSACRRPSTSPSTTCSGALAKCCSPPVDASSSPPMWCSPARRTGAAGPNDLNQIIVDDASQTKTPTRSSLGATASRSPPATPCAAAIQPPALSV